MTEKHPKEMSREAGTHRGKKTETPKEREQAEKKPSLFVVKEKRIHSMNEGYIWFI